MYRARQTLNLDLMSQLAPILTLSAVIVHSVLVWWPARDTIWHGVQDMFAYLQRKQVIDVCDPQVAKHMEGHRLNNLLAVMNVCLHVILLLLPILSFTVTFTYKASELIIGIAGCSLYIMSLVVYSLCAESNLGCHHRFVIRRIFPEKRWADMIYVLLMVDLLLVVLVAPCHALRSLASIVRVTLGAANLNSNQTAGCNVVFTIATVVMNHTEWHCQERHEMTLRDIGELLVVLLVPRIYGRLVQAEVRSSIALSAAKANQTALNAVLNATCDAVVHLDTDLCFMGPSSQLAALLLYDVDQQFSNGLKFKDVLASEEDVRIFDQHIRGIPLDIGCQLAQAMLVHLQDRLRNHIRCHIFYAWSVGSDGSTGYVIGIREHGEKQVGCGDMHDFPSEMSSHVGRGRSTEISYMSDGSLATFAQHRSQLLETKCWARRLVIVAALLQWHLKTPAGWCCQFHYMVNELSSVQSHLATYKCVLNQDDKVIQCPTCGLIDVELCRESRRCRACTSENGILKGILEL